METIMTTAASYTQLPKDPTWFGRAENWLDRKGKGAWIAAMGIRLHLFLASWTGFTRLYNLEKTCVSKIMQFQLAFWQKPFCNATNRQCGL